MNDRDLSVALWIMVVALIIIVTVMVTGVVVAAFVHPAVGGAVAGATILLIGWYVWISLHETSAEEGLETYLLGHHWKTYLSPAFAKALWDAHEKGRPRGLAKYQALDSKSLGIANTGWAFLPRGFFKVARFSHEGQKVALHDNEIFTKASGEESYRVLLQGTPTMQIRFLTLRALIPAMSILKRRFYVDLTRQCPIPIRDGKYQDTRLAWVIWKHATEVILEAGRNAATQFTWEGDQDIVENKHPFEMSVLWIIAEHGSILDQSGVLIRPKQQDGRELTLKQCRTQAEVGDVSLADFYGHYILSADYNVVGLGFAQVMENESEATRSVNVPFVATREKFRLEEEGKGRAAATKAVTDKTDVDDELAYTVNALRDRSGDVNLTQFGGSVTDLFQSVTGRRRPKRRQQNQGEQES